MNSTYNVNELNDLIESTKVKFVSSNQRLPQRAKFTLSNKIRFAYDFYNIVGNKSILEVLVENDDTNQPFKRSLIEFIVEHNLLRPYPNTGYEFKTKLSNRELNHQRSRSIGVREVIRQYNHQNWLEPFDEDEIFSESTIKHPAYHVYINPFGEKVTFDKEAAASVKAAVIEQNIVPARCIVEGAYSYVVKGEFNTYIAKVKNKSI